MALNAIVRRADGTLVSIATVVSGSLPTELEAVVLPREINWTVERWDPATRSIVPKSPRPPDVDRINDFLARVTFLDARLTAAQRTQFRTILATFLGSQRFRDPSEKVEL